MRLCLNRENNRFSDTESVWSLLFICGYLKTTSFMPDRSVGQQTMPLIITNEETKEIFVDQCIKELVNNRFKGELC